MRLNAKPIAYVDESGFIVPNPNYSDETIRSIKGKFLFTKEELELAISEMNRLQDARRTLADKHYGAEAVDAPYVIDNVEEAVKSMARERETVPSFTASPSRGRKKDGESKRVTMPNEVELPDSLHKEPSGINLTEEELEVFNGIDKDAAVAALFGEQS